MLGLHSGEHGYTEVEPPFLVNSATLYGTGQLPKFEQTCSRSPATGILFLIPTAEVPVTNLYRGEILDGRRAASEVHVVHPLLPQRGGILRQRRPRADPAASVRQGRTGEVHDARDVCTTSSKRLTANAERVLQLLGLPYRTVLLCTGDMGFSSAKTYDIEVWLPSQKIVSRDLVVFELRRRFRRGAPTSATAAGNRQGGVRAHAERIWPRGRAHLDCDSRELSAGRRLRRHSRSAAAVHGRTRGDRARPLNDYGTRH